MPHGVKTDEEVVAQFRAHYLYSGNVSKSARAVGLAVSTGRDIARRLVDDPEFTKARRQLRAQALDELVQMRMQVARTSLKRFATRELVTQGGGENAVVIDKSPEYGRLVLDAEKNAQHLAKFDAEKNGEIAEKPKRIEVILTDVAAASEPEPTE